MPIDETRAKKVGELLTALKSDVSQLRTYAAMSSDEFSGDSDRQFAAKRVLQLAVERAKDISDTLVGGPTGGRGRVRRLVDGNVIPRAQGDSFTVLTRLRNDLAHRYEGVSVSQVYKALQRAPDRIDEFAQCVTQYLEREGIA